MDLGLYALFWHCEGSQTLILNTKARDELHGRRDRLHDSV
jgi:hypothetical protein